jgi:hypothetical protein
MTVERAPRPIGSRSASICSTIRETSPVCAVRVGIEHAEICDEMLFVVACERWIGRR